jgi:WhiB family redox-sensing transcriptional regulator
MTAVEILDDDRDLSVDWRDLAVCKGRLELFFGHKSERPQARVQREAKALRLCTMCVVQAPCRQAARRNREYGYWGAESELDRHMAGFSVAAPVGLKSRRSRAATAT